MLRKIRILLATLMFVGITLLFLDFTGAVQLSLGWMTRIQFLPALLALNIGIIIGLLALTLVFGRVYCSVICPLGVMQDISTWLSGRRKGKKYRFGFSPERKWLRYTILAVFVVAIILGIGTIVALLAPYGTYGRIAQNLFSPVWAFGNNILAHFAENADSYAFTEKAIFIKNIPAFIISAVTFVVLIFLAWKYGRIYCNAICPVGTMLGFFSRFSWLKPVINTDKCNGCGLCGRACKASCIDTKNHRIDYSRCVACMDCIGNCHQKAISYTHPKSSHQEEAPVDLSRRNMLTGLALVAGVAAVKAKDKLVDGGLAEIIDKEAPDRETKIVPPGAIGIRHLEQHCTACQLCVAACPNDVLRPSSSLGSLMQVECSYEHGYCRPECTKCSQVCPTGAIKPITPAEKSAIQVGHAVWMRKNCVVLTDDVDCGNCARHCPNGAIAMVPSVAGDESSRKIPAIDTERCIGCGACENLCPARPFSAIYVEGHEVHRMI